MKIVLGIIAIAVIVFLATRPSVGGVSITQNSNQPACVVLQIKC